MKRLKAELETFDTDDSHYYLRVNGKVVAALLPSDFIKIAEAIPSTHNSRAHVRAEIEAYYAKERAK